MGTGVESAALDTSLATAQRKACRDWRASSQIAQRALHVPSTKQTQAGAAAALTRHRGDDGDVLGGVGGVQQRQRAARPAKGGGGGHVRHHQRRHQGQGGGAKGQHQALGGWRGGREGVGEVGWGKVQGREGNAKRSAGGASAQRLQDPMRRPATGAPWCPSHCSPSYARGGSILWMYWMASAACSRPKTKKEAKCSLISTALKPMTGMLAAGGAGRGAGGWHVSRVLSGRTTKRQDAGRETTHSARHVLIAQPRRQPASQARHPSKQGRGTHPRPERPG